VTADYAEVRNVEVASGTFITEADNISKAKVAVLGPTTAQDFVWNRCRVRLGKLFVLIILILR